MVVVVVAIGVAIGVAVRIAVVVVVAVEVGVAIGIAVVVAIGIAVGVVVTVTIGIAVRIGFTVVVGSKVAVGFDGNGVEMKNNSVRIETLRASGWKTLHEYAAEKGVATGTVRRWVRAGTVDRAQKIGGMWMFPPLGGGENKQ